MYRLPERRRPKFRNIKKVHVDFLK